MKDGTYFFQSLTRCLAFFACSGWVGLGCAGLSPLLSARIWSGLDVVYTVSYGRFSIRFGWRARPRPVLSG